MKKAKSLGQDQASEEGTRTAPNAIVPPTAAAAADPGCRRGQMPMASHERLIPEPVESKTPQRRRFTAEYKLRILREVEQCTKHGQIVALLRRERLYFSHLSTWRKQRDEAIVAGVMPKRRGRKPKARDSLSVENKRLQRENRRLMAKLRQTETAIGVAEDTSSEDERSPQVIH